MTLTTFPAVWLLIGAIALVLAAWCALTAFVVDRIATRIGR